MKIQDIEISNPDKLIFANKGITKLEMVRYYEKIADKMLPYLENRPLTLQRFPDGIEDGGFFQKNAADYFPDFIETVSIETENGSNLQVVCNNKKTLIYLANQGTVTFHIWLATQDNLNKPDKVVFDLDPPENSFEKVKTAAGKIRDLLINEGKEPRLMTSGKKGLHVWYPVDRYKNFDDRREEVKELAEKMKEKHPNILTTATRKEKRNHKIFVDYLRNAYGQTTVCPYSLRPINSAGVATPLEWNELSKIKKGDHYTQENIFRRLGQKY
ncbi:non-homologous end-joining DNA ligase [Psychroflexus aestuariivivens]|uniref:non-homologous end-joining DNA ligase n=1 Tax=Psychroflexus aestuariivivens TaxID=1795040 RepID=UPI000FD93999|nr:non-homologous end-joining DNA ligase [Psychroflexus aestuariivivens]